VWERITARWRKSGPGVEWYTHGATPVAFCDLCQLVLCNGTPRENAARILEHDGRKYIFCSEPCAWIFAREPERYADHKDVVKRILAGEAPANMLELVRKYFDLTPDVRGRDMMRGRYPWLTPALATQPE
jgi:toluene monooxygenase system protein A